MSTIPLTADSAAVLREAVIFDTAFPEHLPVELPGLRERLEACAEDFTLYAGLLRSAERCELDSDDDRMLAFLRKTHGQLKRMADADRDGHPEDRTLSQARLIRCTNLVELLERVRGESSATVREGVLAAGENGGE